jgi:flagellar motor protein MotB
MAQRWQTGQGAGGWAEGPDDGSSESGSDLAPTATVWAVFGDLMAGLLGAFVLMLVCLMAVQLELVTDLEAEVRKRQVEERRRVALEQALAAPLAAGRVTLSHGRIAISGSVLFALNSDQLQPEGRQLLQSLAGPLAAYLGNSGELLMVSGFTDDQPVSERNRQFQDNWELSAQRALTVTRALIEAGLPASSVFSAAFGPEQPVASNADAAGRARNRRVEIAPVPRAAGGAASPPR